MRPSISRNENEFALRDCLTQATMIFNYIIIFLVLLYIFYCNISSLLPIIILHLDYVGTLRFMTKMISSYLNKS